MKPAPIPENDAARLAALRSYNILDSEPEPQFDALVKVAAHIAGAPMALLTLIDSDRQWFKAHHGLGGRETKRDVSFCGHAVASGMPLVVEDSLLDERFADNPYVIGEPNVRFYAGLPLRTPDGHVLGTLCALDSVPRQLTDEQLQMLDLLAQQAVALLEARRRNIALETFRKTLDQTPDSITIVDAQTMRYEYVNEGAARLTKYARHELMQRNPVELLAPSQQDQLRASLRAAIESGQHASTFETSHVDRHGNETPVEVVLQFIPGDGQHRGRVISITRDISERRRVEQLQAEFVSTVSHELRTPLTSIRGSLGLVAGGVTGVLPAEAKEYVDIALSNSDRLVRLINDILDVEKMQSGKMEFRIQALPLQRLFAQSLAANEPLAATAGLKLVTTAAIPDVEVAVDPDRFAQVITNLVSNATKFGPAGTSIEISVSLQRDTVRIGVRDHGPGIPPDFKDRMFQRFAQAEPVTTRQKGGTGLGLNISKSIVERLGGTLSYEEAEGGGACFVVELPALPRPEPTSNGRPRILVCEDDPHVYRQIVRALEAGGYAVDVAPTLERARRLLATRTYAAVTLDLVLADGEGSDLLGELDRIPVIVISGSNRDLGRAAVLVTDVIAKPFREERLLEVIRSLVGPTHATPPRILHVEDDGDLRRIVRRTLPSDWKVTGAESMQQARRLLSAQTYDAVVIDLALPDGSGAELIAEAGSARVIIFSAQEVSSELSRRVSSALVKTRSSAEDLRAVLATLVATETS